MEKTKTNKREWVKTVLIIFLVIMLILTFFSNTIMNRSLPEVATQTVYSGAINAKIRGSGTIAANETYDVALSQTRKVKSVMVRTGDEVQVGDLLLTLEPMDSQELQQAKELLADLELAYQKNLISSSNNSSAEDRSVQKLRDAYNEALELYQLYSNEDPDLLVIQLEAAKIELDLLQQQKEDINNDLNDAKESQQYIDASNDLQSYQDAYDAAVTVCNEKQAIVNRMDSLPRIIKDQILAYGDNYEEAEALYDAFVDLIDRWLIDEDIYANEENIDILINLVLQDEKLGKPEVYGDDVEIYARQLQNAYHDLLAIKTDEAELAGLLMNEISIRNAAETAQQDVDKKERDLRAVEGLLDSYDRMISGMQDNLEYVEKQILNQNVIVDTLSKASSAGAALKAAEEQLEDKLFEMNLGDSSYLDVQKDKEAIEKQKELIETLSAEADGQDIYSTVSGVVSTIHTSAGNTVGAEMPVISITIADRGYTMQIPVTVEQARKVNIGDTAEITNYWYGNITATLENIINDPQNMNGGKILMFRLTGDEIQPGTNLTLSIGQRSANYDALVPNSAIRTDSNGKFVLVIVAKSSPLGNRYIATRADVQVLASDDTMSAVSGLAYGDFVITTSTVPIEAGNQVRLVDNG